MYKCTAYCMEYNMSNVLKLCIKKNKYDEKYVILRLIIVMYKKKVVYRVYYVLFDIQIWHLILSTIYRIKFSYTPTLHYD